MSATERNPEDEALRAIEALASGTAHHLNNLLAVVVARLQLAMHTADSPEVRRHLVVAEGAAQDSAQVVRWLSRLSGPGRASRTALDLNQLAERVADSLRPLCGARIDLTLEPGPASSVAGDPALVEEVLGNFVLNAIDALPNGGRIVIRTWDEDDRVCCSVSDTGVGMPPEVQQRALEPFFTTKGTTRIGLGLTVNYGIIRAHGGRLRIESAVGRGTTVTFDLPCLPSPLPGALAASPLVAQES